MAESFSLDRSITPGNDFFAYVNGPWIAAHPIPDAKASYGVFNVLADTAMDTIHTLLESDSAPDDTSGITAVRTFYSAVMDEPGIEAAGLAPIEKQLTEIDAISNRTELENVLARTAATGRSLIWRLGVDVDDRDSTQYLMRLYQSGLGLPDRDFYFNEGERFDTIRSAYRTYLEDLFTLLKITMPQATAEAVYTLEVALAKISMPRADQRDPNLIYNLVDVADLPHQFPGLDWARYLEMAGLGQLTALNVSHVDFLKQTLVLLDTESLETWKSYLAVRLMAPLMGKLPSAFESLTFDFYGRVLSGVREREPRFRIAIAQATHLMLEPVGELYVTGAFDAASKALITTMVERIRTALGRRIDTLAWMSDATKAKAHEKLATFVPLLGYPETWRDYSELELSGSYVEQFMELVAYEWRRDVARIGRPVDRGEWIMSPAVVNACYWPNLNTITFPAAILQPPFFAKDQDMAVNYGGIGAVIGHEITHGFDDEGSEFDAYGNLQSWWTVEDRAAFDALGDMLAKQYDAYELHGQHVNGRLTLGENIADLGGIHIAYDALIAHSTDEPELARAQDGQTMAQRFFYGYATSWCASHRPEDILQRLVSDPHAPDVTRVNGVVANVDAFYEAFDIHPKDALYKAPEERIRIW